MAIGTFYIKDAEALYTSVHSLIPAISKIKKANSTDEPRVSCPKSYYDNIVVSVIGSCIYFSTIGRFNVLSSCIPLHDICLQYDTDCSTEWVITLEYAKSLISWLKILGTGKEIRVEVSHSSLLMLQKEKGGDYSSFRVILPTRSLEDFPYLSDGLVGALDLAHRVEPSGEGTDPAVPIGLPIVNFKTKTRLLLAHAEFMQRMHRGTDVGHLLTRYVCHKGHTYMIMKTAISTERPYQVFTVLAPITNLVGVGEQDD